MELDEKQIQSIVKSLKFESYIWIGTLVILAGLSFFFASDMKKLDGSTTIMLQSLLLLLMLLGLPGIFIWFRKKMTALTLVEDLHIRLTRYETYSRIRQAVFFLVGLLVLFMAVFTIMKGAPMLFLVVVVLSLFIMPSRGRLIMEASLVNPEPEEEVFVDEESYEEDEDLSDSTK